MEWAHQNNIQVPKFSIVLEHTSDLLDVYMEYKKNLDRLKIMIGNPSGYKRGPGREAIEVNVEELVNQRALMREEMHKIVSIIDDL